MKENLKCINLYHLSINNNKQIGLKYYSDKVINALIKNWGNAKWSKIHNMVYILNTKENLDRIYKDFKGVAWINGRSFFNKRSYGTNNNKIVCYKTLSEHIKLEACPKTYLDKLIIKNYAINTCKTYISLFKRFAAFHKTKKVDEINEQDISIYINYLAGQNCSKSFLNQMINAIKFYYEIVLEMPNRFYAIDRPRKTETLPKVIGKQDVVNMIRNSANIKHKAIISVLYSSGMRRSELLNLKINNIDSKRMMVFIKNSKGGKDRYVQLSQTTLLTLRKYYKKWKPKEYLFEGQKGGKYSASSIANILDVAAKRSNINIKVTSHILRHSFATHLLEDGVDLRTIQTILGHNSSRTTEIYTHIAKKHISNFVNPLDSVNFNE